MSADGFAFSVPPNNDLETELANATAAETTVNNILNEGLQSYQFADDNLIDSLKPLSDAVKENCAKVIAMRQQNYNDHKTLQSTSCSLKNLESSLSDLKNRLKKAPILRRTFKTPYDLINMNAICEIVDDDNFLLKCFVDKDDFIVLCFNKISMEWDFHSATFEVPDAIKDILTVEKNSSLFFLEVVDYFSKKQLH